MPDEPAAELAISFYIIAAEIRLDLWTDPQEFTSYDAALQVFDMLKGVELCEIFDGPFDRNADRVNPKEYDRDGLITEIIRTRIGSDIKMPRHLPSVQEAVNVLSRLGIKTPLG